MKEAAIKPMAWVFMVVISIIAILTAHFFIDFICNFSALYFSYDFDIPAHFDLSGLHFGIDDSHPLWTFDSAVTIYLSRPLTALIFGFGVFLLSMRMKRKQLSSLLFLIWANILGFHTALSLFVEDAFTQTGVYQVMQLMHINVIFLVMFAALSIYFMIIIGIMNGRLLYLSLPARLMQSARQKYLFLLLAFVLPWFLLVGITMIGKDGQVLFGEIMMNLSIGFILFPFLLTKKPDHQLFRIKTVNDMSYRDLMIVGILLILMAVLLFWMKQGVSITAML